ncbi:mycofactocin-coupled SDR family oxidoreductase [Acidiferrimicrobium sp. IK]|uniref:mycofactocin-coupled SDR family oxidoreductase n=1 Tax=Acidiferrimicrobium sp. IK TaxID=2871700 RepID=UPI0021CB91CA|nr:mycofactocin-coupled SDR family oxidoreductase [Acidiferrimicrobium sp. IK]MCU4186664.1 mycofactocin-coupled SDR family oxidoreductase [Acidiferrimicrobium sp. IK]
MGTLDGKVAFITGIGRGQGRAHAQRLSADGASIIGIDICANVDSMDYPNASDADLKETVRLVEQQGGRIIAQQADVRDPDALGAALDRGVGEFGRLDIVVANAGIIRLSPNGDIDPSQIWTDIIDTNLTGVWHTTRLAIPHIVAGGRGGSVVITSSTAGIKGTGTDRAGGQAYTAAKRGLVGLMQVLANQWASERIRVNTIHPTGVASGMTMNDAMISLVAEGDVALAAMQNALPIEILQPSDIANAVAWLVSDEASFVTGVALPLDAGFTVR